MKSKTSVASTLGVRVFLLVLSKQNFNNTISRIAQVVAVANYLSRISYFYNFLEAQGVIMYRNVILWDN